MYCGFPRALNATFVAKKVFAERGLLPVGTAAHAIGTGYLCLILRKVTEFAGKVYVNVSATPSKVDVTGATAVARLACSPRPGAAASVVTFALDATFAPPRSIAVRAAEDWALTTLTIRSPVFLSRVTTWRNGSAGLSSVKLPHSWPSR